MQKIRATIDKITNNQVPWVCEMKPIASVLLGVLLCTGCAPLPITVATLVADGFSYATTEKSLTDHGLSMLSDQDCAVHRLLSGDLICRNNDDMITVAANDTAPAALTAAVQPVVKASVKTTATPNGNVTVTHLGSISDPIPGVYMVVASSRDALAARTYSSHNRAIAPQVFAMPVGGRRAMYHVIVGPVTQSDFIAAKKAATESGFGNVWALKIDEADWRRSRELEKRTQQRLSAQRNTLVN